MLHHQILYIRKFMKKQSVIIILSTLFFSLYCILPLNAESYKIPKQDETLEKAIKWYRVSAEKKALYRQTFLAGTQYVSNIVQNQNLKPHTWGVILDIDETVLDNSFFFQKYLNCLVNENSFEAYITMPGKSTALPGAKAFTHHVHNLGGYVSLVTNRDGTFSDKTGTALEATIKNLKYEGVYFDQVVMANYRDAENASDKNLRFDAVKTGKYNKKLMIWSHKLPAHKIIAYFGDNIQDFPELKQKNLVDISGDSEEFDNFGNGYFILPNPMYGSWKSNHFELIILNQ